CAPGTDRSERRGDDRAGRAGERRDEACRHEAGSRSQRPGGRYFGGYVHADARTPQVQRRCGDAGRRNVYLVRAGREAYPTLEHSVLFLQISQSGSYVRHGECDAELVFAACADVEPVDLKAQSTTIGVVGDLGGRVLHDALAIVVDRLEAGVE